MLNINDDVWDAVLPDLTVVEVSTEDDVHAVAKDCKTVDKVVRAAVELGFNLVQAFHTRSVHITFSISACHLER